MESERKRVVAYGYVIADELGRIQYATIRPNRAACWKEFPLGRKEAKRQGFKCVPVWIKEHRQS